MIFIDISILSGVIVILITFIAIFGVKQSALVNNIISFLAVFVIVGVIFGGIPFVKIENWTADFFPYLYHPAFFVL